MALLRLVDRGAILVLCTLCLSLAAEVLPSDSTPGLAGSGPRELSPVVCTKPEECRTIQHAKCNLSSRQCICENGYSPMGSKRCGKKLGDPCNESNRCDALNSRCHGDDDEGICMCDYGLTASADRTFCYGRPLLYHDLCDDDDNCTSLGHNVICKGHSCVCKDNYSYQSSHGVISCKEQIDNLGAKCNAETQVCNENSTNDIDSKRDCIKGVCQCMSRFAPDDGVCKEKIGLLGAPCNDTHACYLEEDGDNQKIYCLKGICQCKKNFVLNDGKCKKKVGKIGDSCKQNTEICYVDDDGERQRRHCLDGICRCKQNFKNENGQCKEKIRLGAFCDPASDVCHVEEDGAAQRAYCHAGVCQCKNGFVIENGKCIMKAEMKSGASHFTSESWLLLLLGTFRFLR